MNDHIQNTVNFINESFPGGNISHELYLVAAKGSALPYLLIKPDFKLCLQ